MMESSPTDRQAVSELSVPVPWGEIRGKAWGPDQGLPVLCLHGWADNCGSFDTLIPLLPKEFRYVAFDLPGHGLSSHLPPGVFYTHSLFMMDINRVIDALQWERFSIVAHSIGGIIGSMFSAVYPEKVVSLVLLDSYGFPTYHMPAALSYRMGMDKMLQHEKTQKKGRKVHTFEQAAKRLLAASKSLSEDSVHIMMKRSLCPVDGGHTFTTDVRLHMLNDYFSLEQSLSLQSKIKSPTLLILAEDGLKKIFNDRFHNKVVAVLTQGWKDAHHTMVTLPGAHHFHMNNPELVAPLVSDFLRTKVSAEAEAEADSPKSKL